MEILDKQTEEHKKSQKIFELMVKSKLRKAIALSWKGNLEESKALFN